MINLIKFLPIKLKAGAVISDEVKGPSFSSARPEYLLFSASILRFKSPGVWWIGINADSFSFENYDAMKKGGFRKSNTLSSLDHSWITKMVMMRKFVYYGEWFSGDQGWTIFSASVVKQNEEDTAKAPVNFLHAQNFEYFLLDYLDFQYGDRTLRGKKPRFEGPTDWKPKVEFPVPAVAFTFNSRSTPCQVFAFAVDSETIAIMEFYHICTDATIDAQKELASAIINTFEYEPNQEISKQMADIRKSEGGSPELSKTMSPRDWPVRARELKPQPTN